MSASLIQETPDARLELIQAQVAEGSLTLQYTIRNKSVKTMYLFNRIYSEIGADKVFHTNVNTVYVEVVDEKVIFSKKVIAVPPDLDVEQPVVPCAIAIPPGGSATEILKIALPVRPFSAYRNVPEGTLASNPLNLEGAIELGAIFVPPEAQKFAIPVTTTDGPAFRFPSVDPARQLIFRVGPFLSKVPVRVPK